VLQTAPAEVTARLTALLVGITAAGLSQGLALWHRPTRRGLMWRSMAIALLVLVVSLGLQWRMPDLAQRRWVMTAGAMCAFLATLGLWFVVAFRAHQIAARLRELDERDRAAAMAHQLAAAQIQPHFLFNSLAALQHWVQQKDDRAAPMLGALTGFLRATLPLFDRSLLRLGDEAAAVQRYLEVMGLRLGDRLRAVVRIDAAAADAMLPPGVLLTLVENAIEHGVLPSLSGAELSVRAQVEDAWLMLEVSDTGSGLIAEAGEGVGLANSRARLRQACGESATLSLLPGPAGGCVARVRIPCRTAANLPAADRPGGFDTPARPA
jgi:LytS/YehU family sensor histidine kinase